MIVKLLNKINNIIKFAVVTLSGDDSGDYNQTQVSYMGKTKQVLVLNPYGLDANLPKDTLMVLLNIMGQEENIAGIGSSQNARFKNLAEGEVAVGNPGVASKIYFKANGDIEIESSGVVNINGDTEPVIRGTAMQTLYNAHTHLGNLGAPTGTPVVAMSATELSTKNFTE